jgi:hypothetical protein
MKLFLLFFDIKGHNFLIQGFHVTVPARPACSACPRHTRLLCLPQVNSNGSQCTLRGPGTYIVSIVCLGVTGVNNQGSSADCQSSEAFILAGS